MHFFFYISLFIYDHSSSYIFVSLFVQQKSFLKSRTKCLELFPFPFSIEIYCRFVKYLNQTQFNSRFGENSFYLLKTISCYIASRFLVICPNKIFVSCKKKKKESVMFLNMHIVPFRYVTFKLVSCSWCIKKLE